VKAGDRITGVDVELTNRLASIAGLVTTSRGDAAKDYTLVLFAADARRWKAGTGLSAWRGRITTGASRSPAWRRPTTA
jgi:hypothetical protein